MAEARVLIVEDNDEIAQMLVLFFGARGLKVTVAPDGGTALAMLRESLPTLVLLDVGLPDTDGYDLFRKFRQSARTRHVPVIFLTRRSRKSDRLAGLQLGADDFITKPFDLEELFLRVQNCAARAQREHLSDLHTGLPAGQITRQVLAETAENPARSAVAFRLCHLSQFRDLYGALAVADLMRYTALLLNRVLNNLGSADDFLGQLSEDAFVVVTTPDLADRISRTVVERFNHDAVQHYAMGERSGDQVKVRDSAGREWMLPIVALQAGPAP
jgi:DNA-binding response OmpR family regulator